MQDKILICCLLLFTTINASTNGALYQCNADLLAEDVCVFEAVDTDSTFGPSFAYDIDGNGDFDEDGSTLEAKHRQIFKVDGMEMNVGMAPWADGYYL